MSVFTSTPLTEDKPPPEDSAVDFAVDFAAAPTVPAVPAAAAPIALLGGGHGSDIHSLKRIPKSSALPSAAASPTAASPATTGTNTPSYPPSGSRSPVRRYPGYAALSPALASPATSGVLSPSYAPSDGASDLRWSIPRPFPNSSAGSASERDENGFVPLQRFSNRLPYPLPRRYSTGDLSAALPEVNEENGSSSEDGVPLCRFPRPVPPSSGAGYRVSSGSFCPVLGSNVEEPGRTPSLSVPQVLATPESPRAGSPPPATSTSAVQLMLTIIPESEEAIDAIAEHFLQAAEGIRKEEEGFQDFTVLHRGEEVPQELLVMFT